MTEEEIKRPQERIKDKEKYVAEPPTDLTDEEWEYMRYVGVQIMARNPKPLGFEEWKDQNLHKIGYTEAKKQEKKL